jgi:hypothetical protein
VCASVSHSCLPVTRARATVATAPCRQPWAAVARASMMPGGMRPRGRVTPDEGDAAPLDHLKSASLRCSLSKHPGGTLASTVGDAASHAREGGTGWLHHCSGNPRVDTGAQHCADCAWRPRRALRGLARHRNNRRPGVANEDAARPAAPSPDVLCGHPGMRPVVCAGPPSFLPGLRVQCRRGTARQYLGLGGAPMLVEERKSPGTLTPERTSAKPPPREKRSACRRTFLPRRTNSSL